MLKTIREIFFTVLVVVVVATVISIVKSERRAAQQPTPQVATQQDKQRSAEKMNVELNRGLPTMLDSQTMLTKAVAETNSTTYYIKMVNYPSAYLDQDFLIKAQEIIGRQNCADSDIRWSFDQGMHMKYIVSGSDNQQAGSFIISKVYCQRFR